MPYKILPQNPDFEKFWLNFVWSPPKIDKETIENSTQ